MIAAAAFRGAGILEAVLGAMRAASGGGGEISHLVVPGRYQEFFHSGVCSKRAHEVRPLGVNHDITLFIRVLIQVVDGLEAGGGSAVAV